MMQKLFARCNEGQRIFILNQLLPDLPAIALSTQGTHTLQAFVPLITSEQEINLIVDRMTPHIVELAPATNSTHFLQKIVVYFPFAQTISFYKVALSNFSSFAKNKNCICILKHMMKKIRDM